MEGLTDSPAEGNVGGEVDDAAEAGGKEVGRGGGHLEPGVVCQGETER